MNLKLWKQHAGLGIIGWIAIIPLIIIGLIILAFIGTELNKAYWDHKVKKMCKEDGGVTVYEKVTLTQEEYKRLKWIKGNVAIPSNNNSMEAYPFFRDWKITKIRKSFPEVWKSEIVIKRSFDEKTLGKVVYYGRRGGDFPTGLAHDSSYGCPDNTDLMKQIFVIEGE